MKDFKSIAVAAGALTLSVCLPGSAATAGPLPTPILYLTGQEYYSANGQNFVRYGYDVLNKDAYAAELFAAAPSLPPCGSNTNSSRSWVDFFDSRG
jgi:hypothetical protein